MSHRESDARAQKDRGDLRAADRLGRVVLEQHRNAPQPALHERIGKGATHDHVVRLIDLAEQAGIALDGAIGNTVRRLVRMKVQE